MMPLFTGLMIPFLGTVLGSGMVYLTKKELNIHFHKFLLGFASGVMMAASVWSLLIPSLDMSNESFVPAAVGFLCGMFFLLILDYLVPHMHLDKEEPDGKPSTLKKSTMLVLAVTLHNFPEGMAVGVVLSGMLSGNEAITMTSALALSLGIALQNIPEGAVISLPLRAQGMNKHRAFMQGALSGIVEPMGALLTLLLTPYMTGILPYMLSFAAGAMIYVVVEELIPEAQHGDHSDIGTIGVALGFALMMILDVALG